MFDNTMKKKNTKKKLRNPAYQISQHPFGRCNIFFFSLEANLSHKDANARQRVECDRIIRNDLL